MDYTDFEYLLNENLSVLQDVMGIELKKTRFKNNNSDISFYSNDGFFVKGFYGVPYNHITLHVDENDEVESISIHFREVIDFQLYNSLIAKYGEPNNIQVVDNRKIISETVLKDKNDKIIGSSRKGEFYLREGIFEEDPLYIIWTKKSYQIKCFLRHEQNMSEITFSVSND